MMNSVLAMLMKALEIFFKQYTAIIIVIIDFSVALSSFVLIGHLSNIIPYLKSWIDVFSLIAIGGLSRFTGITVLVIIVNYFISWYLYYSLKLLIKSDATRSFAMDVIDIVPSVNRYYDFIVLILFVFVIGLSNARNVYFSLNNLKKEEYILHELIVNGLFVSAICFRYVRQSERFLKKVDSLKENKEST